MGGVIASDGKEMANGVKMAVDEINAKGGLIGYHLDYVEIDDKDSNTDQITAAFNRAASVEKPDVIFSGYHLGSGPEFDIVANAGVLYYNVNTQVAWVQTGTQADPSKYWGIFQCDPTETWYGQGFAYWVDGALNRACSTQGQDLLDHQRQERLRHGDRHRFRRPDQGAGLDRRHRGRRHRGRGARLGPGAVQGQAGGSKRAVHQRLLARRRRRDGEGLGGDPDQDAGLSAVRAVGARST